jgi:HEAT repeat protein
MRGAIGRISRFLLLGLATATLSGCASWSVWPWNKDRTDIVPGITPPSERVALLRDLAKKAGSATPESRESISAQLAAVYRDERDPLIRVELVRTLSHYPTESSTGVLKAALSDADADVRIASCRAWAKRPDPDAASLLAQTLGSDTDGDVRLAAAESLGELGRGAASAAVPALGLALEDRDPAMQYYAVVALQKVTGKSLGNDVDQWRQYVKNELPESTKPVSVGEQFRRMF